MKLNAYCIYDRKTLAYFPPFYAPTHGGAVRSLTDLVADNNTTVGRHPNDYVLFCIGQFDDQNGALEPKSPLEHVIDASALVAALQQEIPFPAAATSSKVRDELVFDAKRGE